jgi:sec-independent protein translocase protein TatA
MTLNPVLALFGSLGTSEVLLILLIIVLLFGAAKIPDLARSLGRAQREFQKARDQIESEVNTPVPKAPVAPTAASVDSPEAKLLRDAEALGISTEGKSMEEIKAEITKKTSG